MHPSRVLLIEQILRTFGKTYWWGSNSLRIDLRLFSCRHCSIHGYRIRESLPHLRKVIPLAELLDRRRLTHCLEWELRFWPMSQFPVHVHADPDHQPQFVGTIVGKSRVGGKSCVRACRSLYEDGMVLKNLGSTTTYCISGISKAQNRCRNLTKLLTENLIANFFTE